MSLVTVLAVLFPALIVVIATHQKLLACDDQYDRAQSLVCLEDKHGKSFAQDLELDLENILNEADPSEGSTIDEKLRKLYRPGPDNNCPIWENNVSRCCRTGCSKWDLLNACRSCFR